MGRGSGGITGSKRGSNKYNPTVFQGQLKDGEKQLKMAYNAKTGRAAAVTAAEANMTSVVRGFPTKEAVEHYLKQANDKLEALSKTSMENAKKQHNGTYWNEVMYWQSVSSITGAELKRRNKKKSGGGS